MHHGVILLIVAMAFSLSERDESDAIMFVQSRFTPKMFEVCKDVPSKFSASDYDSALVAWLRKNGRAVSHGERILRDAAKKDGKDFEGDMAQQIQDTVAKLSAYPPGERAKHCEYLLGVVRSEL